MQTLKRITRIATNVRKWAENAHRKGKISGGTYDLRGYCAIASYELFKRLKRAKINAKFAGNKFHAFILTEGHIVDVTATQFYKFRKQSVLITKMPDLRYHKIKYTADNKRQIRKILAKWPKQQKHPDLLK